MWLEKAIIIEQQVPSTPEAESSMSDTEKNDTFTDGLRPWRNSSTNKLKQQKRKIVLLHRKPYSHERIIAHLQLVMMHSLIQLKYVGSSHNCYLPGDQIQNNVWTASGPLQS